MEEIQVYLTGRLGNQLFQYAMARNIQKKYGGKIICNIYDLEHVASKLKHTGGKFDYDMKNLKLNNNVELIEKKLPWYADYSNILMKVIRRTVPRQYFKFMVKKGYLIWRKSEYIEIPDLKTNKVVINGLWQDIRFFNDAVEEIREEITPISEPSIKNKYIYEYSNAENAVCISLRGRKFFASSYKR